MASVIRIFFLVLACICQVSCTQECSEGKFGHNCSGFCSARHCVNQSSCNPVSGICENGCMRGWQGPTCLERIAVGGAADTAGHDTRVIALATAPAVLVVLILVLMAVLIVRIKKLTWISAKKNSPGPCRTSNHMITSNSSHGSTSKDHITMITASNVDSPALDYSTAINTERDPTGGYITAIYTDSATTRDNIQSGAAASNHDYITAIYADSATTRDNIQSGAAASNHDYITATYTDSTTTMGHITATNTDRIATTDHIYTSITPGNTKEHIYTGIKTCNTAISTAPSNYETLQPTEDNPYTSLEGRNVYDNV